MIKSVDLNELRLIIENITREIKTSHEYKLQEMFIETTYNKLQEILPSGTKIIVERRKGEVAPYMAIAWASDKFSHESVDAVVFHLSYDWSLRTVNMGDGGAVLSRKPDPLNPKEKNMTSVLERLPFVPPKQTVEAVTNAILNYAKLWVKTKTDYERRGLTRKSGDFGR